MRMNWLGAGLTFFLSWWLIWMMLLSVGVRNAHEEKVKVGEGEDRGAPVNPMLWKRVVVVTVCAFFVTILMTLAIETGLVGEIVDKGFGSSFWYGCEGMR